MSTPRLVAIVPAEDVLQTLVNGDGRYTLHRVLYDLYSPSFPSRLGPLTVNVIFCGGVGTYAARLRMLSPQGHAVSETIFKFEARTYHLQGITLAGTPVEAPGAYILQVDLEGQIVGSAPLKIVPLDQGANIEGPGR